jgi:hypothetical protein
LWNWCNIGNLAVEKEKEKKEEKNIENIAFFWDCPFLEQLRSVVCHQLQGFLAKA